jgi:hypothetical protein
MNESKSTFINGAIQKRNRHANIRNFIDVTPWMNGSIILSLPQDADVSREPMLAEIAKRGIEYVFVPNPTKQVSTMSKKEKKEYVGFAGLSMTELKSLVKKHEQAHLLTEEDKTVKITSIKNIKPLSDELKLWMPKQWQIYKRKKDLIMDKEDAESVNV